MSKTEANRSNNPLQQIYAHEMRRLADNITLLCEDLFSIQPPRDTGPDDMTVSSEPIYTNLICLILSQSAALKKLFSTSQYKYKKETIKQYNLRIERATAMMKMLGSLPLPTVNDTKPRNIIEHFDEYMDEAVLHYDEGKYEWLYFNIAIKDFAMLPKNSVALKVYSIKTRTFHHFTSVIDIGKLYAEVKQVSELLRPVDKAEWRLAIWRLR